MTDPHEARMRAAAGTMALMEVLDEDGLATLERATSELRAFAERLDAAGVPRFAAVGGIVSFIVQAITMRPEPEGN